MRVLLADQAKSLIAAIHALPQAQHDAHVSLIAAPQLCDARRRNADLQRITSPRTARTQLETMPRLIGLLALCAQASSIAFVTKPVGGFVTRTKALVAEQKAAQKIRKRRKDGAELLYPEWDRLETANNDLSKCFNVLWLGFYAKLYTPLALYFYPGMMPSSYETPVTRARGFASAEKRRKAALEKMLDAFDKAALEKKKVQSPSDISLAHINCAAGVLGASSKRSALTLALGAKGEELPKAALLAASRALDGPYSILPRWMHRGHVKKGMAKLVEGDDALRRSDVEALPVHCLESACAARSLLRPSASEMRSELREWRVFSVSL